MKVSHRQQASACALQQALGGMVAGALGGFILVAGILFWGAGALLASAGGSGFGAAEGDCALTLMDILILPGIFAGLGFVSGPVLSRD